MAGELEGFTIRGGAAPDKCWLPGDWSNTYPGELLKDSEGEAFYRSTLAYRRSVLSREFQRDDRPPFLVKMEAL